MHILLNPNYYLSMENSSTSDLNTLKSGRITPLLVSIAIAVSAELGLKFMGLAY
jgi:hypothetical protein